MTTTVPHPDQLLQNLIRFNTTNPPGRETECISYINTLLTEAGFETTLIAKDPQRPNLIARLSGAGTVPPLLLQGHVDVVTTDGQTWSRPPFEGEIHDGFIWGRGALDMKGGVAMMITAMLRAQTAGLQPAGDIILCILSDEEMGADYGARFLVDEHPELFEGVKYALGEFGGYNQRMAGQKFYPIQVAEKQTCNVRAVIRGTGGHASFINQGGTMAQLGRFLTALDKNLLPLHIHPVVRDMFTRIAAKASFPQSLIIKQLLNPLLHDRVRPLLRETADTIGALFRNTINATIVNGGLKSNVIPSEITVQLDARLLPGFTPEQFFAELRPIVGNQVELELLDHDPGANEVDMGLFDTLASVLTEVDPEGTPIPLMLPAVTDGRHFSRLGIQTYGFTPMQVPDDFHFTSTIHAADERIPVGAVEFGANAIYQVIERYQAQ